MTISTRFLIHAVVLAFIGLLFDGCLIRDPWVNLGNGYEIVAISGRSPCGLCYFESLDPRPGPLWHVMRDERGITLYRGAADQSYDFGDEAALAAAVREKGIRLAPDRDALQRITDITGYAADDRYAIGHSAGGYFLLDMQEDRVETWPRPAEWEMAVQARTRLDPAHLRDPKSWWVQHRPEGYWVIMGSYAVIALLWLGRLLLRGEKTAERSGGPE